MRRISIFLLGVNFLFAVFEALVFQNHYTYANIFMEKESFFIQYVLFVAAAYIGKLMYSKYSDSRGETEDGEKRIGQKDI